MEPPDGLVRSGGGGGGAERDAHAVDVDGEPGGHEHGVESGHRPVEAGQVEPSVVTSRSRAPRGPAAPRPRGPAAQDITLDRPTTTALRTALNALTAAYMTVNRTNKRDTALRGTELTNLARAIEALTGYLDPVVKQP